MNGRIIEFRELLWLTKDMKLTFSRIKRQEFGRYPVEYVSYNVFKVSGARVREKAKAKNDKRS